MFDLLRRIAINTHRAPPPDNSQFRSLLWGSGSRAFRKLVLTFGIAIAIATAYSFWPRRAHLRSFDPAQVARYETGMWRDYYEHKYVSLFRRLYALSREEYGFSPWDSARLAWYAASAAKVFQPSRNRTEAQAALPILERHFAIVQRRGGEAFDVTAAARLELEWWQLRREDSTPERYGGVMARVSEELYGTSNAETKEAGRLRAEMMRYRDERRDGQMGTNDWRHIEDGLARSYHLLKAGISKPP